MNCQISILKGFNSSTEAMGLNCPCGNAEGINDLVSRGQTLVRVGAACSIGIYVASHSALAQTRVWPHKTINDHANIIIVT